MYIALNKDKDRIHISKTIKGEKYFCQECGDQLIVKKGDINAHHFAHKHKCLDSWHYDMTEWHYEWQNQFPLENQEKVFSLYGKTHRADVFINKTVIEFQHSPISESEFNDRNSFYNSLGFHVIWIFDVRDKNIEYLQDSYDGTARFFSWKYPIRFLGNCNRKDITIFLQIDDSIWDRQKEFNDINDFSKLDIKPNLIKIDNLFDGFSQFESRDYYSDVEVLDVLLKKEYLNKKWYDYKLKPIFDSICDQFENFNCTGYDYNYYGYCPKYNKYIRYNEECHGCYNYIPKYNGCNYRFKDIPKEKIKYIYSISRDNDGRIIETDFLFDEGRKKSKISSLPSNVRTIKEFVDSNPNMRVVRFRNTYNNNVVQLGLNNMKKLREYKICEGKLCGYNNYKTDDRPIFSWDKPVWTMIWYKNIDDPDRNELQSNSRVITKEEINDDIENKIGVPTTCPKCGGIIALINKNGKEIIGCSNNNCDYTIWITDWDK